jgi:hypothetical protein
VANIAMAVGMLKTAELMAEGVKREKRRTA